MEVGHWLRTLGLERYEAAFRDNKIDGEILPKLTAEDLKDLGVSLVGDRRRLLDAIGALRPHGGTGTPQAAETPERQVGTDVPSVEAERRQLTVMFCDLVGSTALSGRLDPEDLREIIARYHRCCGAAVDRFGGFIAKYLGDGALAYFGYPQAHEDDAERAVRAGLALVEAVTKLDAGTGTALQVRVGIATGLVVVGDLLGSGEAQERGIVGETPNLAARLQALAEPNTVVIGDATRRLVGNLFELEDLGARDLKGITSPTRAWAALRATAVESRFDALHATGLTALVGREEEFELLLRRWFRAKTGEGQVVLLSGEPGIGKSRITAALLERLAGESHIRLRYFCSPQRADSPLFPFIGQVERAAGLTHDDTPKARLDKLDALLARMSASVEDAALFAEMLSLPNDGRYRELDLSPEQRRRRTLEVLVSQLEVLARLNPVLMIFEDAHWIDPTSLEVIGRVVDRVAGLPILLIVTFRPEFDPPWIGQPHVTAMTINRLTQREVGAMIDRVVGNKPLRANLRHDIIERTDGIPLFVEEMTKAVLEAESESLPTIVRIPSAALAVPASLHASLMARLDRLGSAKELAQIGAAIGREFSHALLASVARDPEPKLGSALDRLLEAGLVFRRGAPPQATYLFKHALVQDAAYGTLLREPRRTLHARIAEALESQFTEITQNQPEVLAHHCTEAGLIEKAAGLWGRAGLRSLDRSAEVEAAAQLNRALTHLAVLPSTRALRQEQVKLQVGLATALMHTKGFAASETKAALDQARLLIERAQTLREDLEDPLLPFSILYGSWVTNFVASNCDAALKIAAQFLAMAEKQRAAPPLMIGHRLMGTSLLFTGKIWDGRAQLDKAIALYDPPEHRALATQFSQDMGVVALSFRSWALWALGYAEAALADADQALKAARESGHAATLIYALSCAMFTNLYCGNYASAGTLTDEAFALADEKGALFWKALIMLDQGCLLTLMGKSSEAIQVITSGIALYRSTESVVHIPRALSFLARAYAELGQFEEAWQAISDATAAVEATNYRWWETEIYRTAGEVSRMSSGPKEAKAEVHFHHALELARERRARTWELRAAMSMARLWRDQGKRQEAHNLLAPVYGWFTEGFDTLDLKEAKALLHELVC